jgi:regulator of sirC expression with transglutaminase-like and TPR domain
MRLLPRRLAKGVWASGLWGAVVLMCSGQMAERVASQENEPALDEPTSGQTAQTARATPEIARLIDALDAETFAEREQATRELLQFGREALGPLQKARTHPSAEVRGRARLIVEELTVGVWRREIIAYAARPDRELDVERGMWLIANLLDPTVTKASLTTQLDRLAARVRKRLGADVDPAAADPALVMRAVQHVLFVEDRFGGNERERYHPDNSSLARVLTTKQGLPIVVSHIVIGVGRRLRVPIVDVPLSGTYIVKYDGTRAPAGFPQDDIFLDPENGGRLYSAGEELERAFPGQEPDAVPANTNRENVSRMLRNLSSSLAAGKDADKRARVEEFIEMLARYEPEETP